MAFLRAFGSYLPSRVVTSEEIGARVGATAEWIRNVSGIEERRFASSGESVADMGARAAEDCLQRAGAAPAEVGLLLVASGSSERRFPGPAASVAARLGLTETPAIDLPMASAGSLFALALAGRLAAAHGNVLVVAAEKMSSVVMHEPLDRATAVLFGDGAGACLVSADRGVARIVDCSLSTDGSFAED
ncbi:MAG: 3-oxoacyl-ACP synthase III family protein, partial [Bryobacteraceae bacterium]